jgi:5'-deoxynucleotidase YfbR-like HD superfamily hydrolase
MKILNLRQLLSGDINRLRHIKRFSTALTLHKESVAEHSYYVSVYSWFISEWVKENTSLQVDTALLLIRCLFHDLEEACTGDFPRPFKYRNSVLKSMIEQESEEVFKETVSKILPSDLSTVEGLVCNWKNSKDTKTVEGAILALADYLSVISHLWLEVGCSNTSMYLHYKSVKEYLATFGHENFDFLRPIVQEVTGITEMIFDRSQQGVLND